MADKRQRPASLSQCPVKSRGKLCALLHTMDYETVRSLSVLHCSGIEKSSGKNDNGGIAFKLFQDQLAYF